MICWLTRDKDKIISVFYTQYMQYNRFRWKIKICVVLSQVGPSGRTSDPAQPPSVTKWEHNLEPDFVHPRWQEPAPEWLKIPLAVLGHVTQVPVSDFI